MSGDGTPGGDAAGGGDVVGDPAKWPWSDGHPLNKPWPPTLREYPPDHPARRDEESKEAFNWDWAVEDFGKGFMLWLVVRQRDAERQFCGDWWMLAMLHRCEALARERGRATTDENRLKEWNAVLEGALDASVCVHLEDAYLKDAHLEHADLWYAHLENAYLRDAHLEHARLWSAHLERAYLRDAHLEHADLSNAHLEHARLWSAHLEHADLGEANLEHADFSNAHLEHARLWSAHLEHADLSGAHLEHADLGESNLEHADLRESNLEHADLREAHLEHADLSEAHLEQANLTRAHLEQADLAKAHLEQAILVHANLVHTNLRNAHLEYANLGDAPPDRADLQEAVLTGADVRGATGLRFDANRVRDIHIEGDAPDPWSVLRRSYTGPWFFVHLALLLAFVLPYVAKVLALTAADHAARMLDHAKAYAPSDLVALDRIPAWRVLFGLDRGWWIPVLGFMLLFYNIVRGVLTIRVGMLRDAEERSGITPTLEEYMGTQGLRDESFVEAMREAGFYALKWLSDTLDGWLYGTSDSDAARPKFELIGLWRLHRLLRVLLLIALASFAIHAIDWIRTTTVPKISTVASAAGSVEVQSHPPSALANTTSSPGATP